MEYDAVRLVNRSNESAHVAAHDFFEWHLLGGDNVHGNVSSAERGSDFEADEAGARNHDMFRVLRPLHDCAAVGKRPQIHHLRIIVDWGAWNREAHGVGAGR